MLGTKQYTVNTIARVEILMKELLSEKMRRISLRQVIGITQEAGVKISALNNKSHSNKKEI